jgi:hypothetical protein
MLQLQLEGALEGRLLEFQKRRPRAKERIVSRCEGSKTEGEYHCCTASPEGFCICIGQCNSRKVQVCHNRLKCNISLLSGMSQVCHFLRSAYILRCYLWENDKLGSFQTKVRCCTWVYYGTPGLFWSCIDQCKCKILLDLRYSSDTHHLFLSLRCGQVGC